MALNNLRHAGKNKLNNVLDNKILWRILYFVMGRTNLFNVVRAIYAERPDISDYWLCNAIYSVFRETPTLKTISVWKSKLRKEGIKIPRKNDDKEGQICSP